MENIASNKLFSLFRKYNQRPVTFIKPGGNFGDEIIYLGAEKIARQAGLKFKTLSLEECMHGNVHIDKIVYVHGGGGFNEYWSQAVRIILEKLNRDDLEMVIIGPQTFFLDEQYIARMFNNLKNGKAGRILIFTREMSSFRAVKQFEDSRISIEIDHDTAFNLTGDDFSLNNNTTNYVFYAIRDDKEKLAYQKIHPFVLWEDPVRVAKTFQGWVELHANAKKIVTNRTHSAILGSILNKEVVMLPNSYHKNRSIWEYSLKQRGVGWMENLSYQWLRENLNNNKLYQRLMNSYKINSAVKRFCRIKGN